MAVSLNNVTLRQNLKKVDTMLAKEGYELRHSHWGYGMAIYRDDFSNANINSYFKLTMIITPKYGDIYTVSFTVEPCRVDLGNSSLALERAKELHRCLGHLIKVCETLNLLKLEGTVDGFRQCVMDIEEKRRRR